MRKRMIKTDSKVLQPALKRERAEPCETHLNGKKLQLRRIAPALRKQAVEDLKAGNVAGFLWKSEHGNQYWLDIVWENRKLLLDLHLFEEALIAAFSATRTNNVLHHDRLRKMFSMGDRERFRQLGDQLPEPGPFVIYRGVAGIGPLRGERGFSWTASLDCAWWFARRYPLPNPSVLRATVKAEDIVAYLNQSHRNEQEFVVLFPDTTELEEMPANEGEEAATRYEREMRATHEAQMESLKVKWTEQKRTLSEPNDGVTPKTETREFATLSRERSCKWQKNGSTGIPKRSG
jgi:hypothetical protein